MKTLFFASFIICMIVASTSFAQLSIVKSKVDTKTYPNVGYSFSVVDSKGRIVLTPDLQKSTTIADSTNGSNVPNIVVTAQSAEEGTTTYDTIWVYPGHPDLGIAHIITTFHPKIQGMSLMIGIDISDSAVAMYGSSDMRYVKSMLNKIVDAMDFAHDKFAIQIIGDQARLALTWSNNLDDIHSAIANIDSWKGSADSLFNIQAAYEDPSTGMRYYVNKAGIPHPAQPGMYMLISSNTQDQISNNVNEGKDRFDDGNTTKIIFSTHDDINWTADRSNDGTKMSFLSYAGIHGGFPLNDGSAYVLTEDTATALTNILYDLQVRGNAYIATQIKANASFIVPDPTKNDHIFHINDNAYNLSQYFHVLNPVTADVKEQQIFKISVYPNPSSNIIFIKSENDQAFSIISTNGNIVGHGTTNIGYDLAQVPAGSYLIRLNDGTVRKIVVVK